EFKRKLKTPEKIAKEICAFANTKGGYVIIGVDDDKSIVGIKSEKTEADIIERACKFSIEPEVVPEIQIFDLEGRDVMVVIIQEGNRKPYQAVLIDETTQAETRQVFIRVGENSMPASNEMKRLLRSQTNDDPLRLGIGDKEKRLFQYLEINNRISVQEYAELVNISRRRAGRLLIRLVRAGVIQMTTDIHNDYYSLIR
ncbi:MAG: ATP-binding protein, partial [Chloroherpetonaceae bacterium]